MKFLVVLLILALCVLHHDVWWWETPARLVEGEAVTAGHPGLVFGFMPIGLAWHTFISIAAGATWFLAVRFCWPAVLDAETDAEEGAGA